MKKILLMLACSFVLLAQASEPPQKFDARRDAVKDVAAAVALASAQGKRVLVDVGGEWCPWCHVMDRFFTAHADARQLRDEGYVFVKVNYSPANRNEQLLAQWPKAPGYPHLFVLDGKGQLLHSQPGAELEGGKDFDREKMLAFLRRHR